MSNLRYMYLDNPINSIDDDVLDRAQLASDFSQSVLSFDLSEGAVVAVLGAWGSGKTSFVNMTKEKIELENVPFFEFNPWMYQGTSDLIERFFVEICLQIKRGGKLVKLGKDLEKYVKSFPGVIGGASRAFVKLLQGHDLRSTVEKRLRELENPLVVFIDDIDRLRTQEIRQVFQLVRLTGKFPNILYVLAFDRVRVESALGDEGITGRDYLEKIVQWSFDLPAIPQSILQHQILATIEHSISEITDISKLDQDELIDVARGVIFPLIRNMRDVKRYAIAIQSTCKNLNELVQIVDVLGLEAIRIFLPAVFSQLHQKVHIITQQDSKKDLADLDRDKTQNILHDLIRSGEEHSDVVKSMLTVHFPVTDRYIKNTSFDSEWQAIWLKNRRVAHRSILLYYLERVLNDDLIKFVFSEIAFSEMTDKNSFEQFLHKVDLHYAEDIVSSLETFTGDFTIEHVVPGVSVLLNFMYQLPRKQKGMFELDSEMVIERVVYRLISVVESKDRVEELLVEILANVNTLSARLRLIQMVGYREHVGQKLISSSYASQIERNWCQAVQKCSVNELIREPKLLLIICSVNEMKVEHEPNISIDTSQEMTLALLRSAQVESLHSKGNLINREQHLLWDPLISVYGEENTLINRINELRNINSEDEELVKLAQKYASGWRPPEFSQR